MESRQAMTEFCIWITGKCHHFRIDLEWFKKINPFFPHIVGITHCYPYTCINNIKPFHTICYIICTCNSRTSFLCYFQAFFIEWTCRPKLFRTNEAKIHTHFYSTTHQCITHIRLSMTHIGIRNFI